MCKLLKLNHPPKKKSTFEGIYMGWWEIEEIIQVFLINDVRDVGCIP